MWYKFGLILLIVFIGNALWAYSDDKLGVAVLSAAFAIAVLHKLVQWGRA